MWLVSPLLCANYNQIANWTEGNSMLEQVSFIRWCSQQELNNLPLCRKDNSFRCNIRSVLPRAPQGSNYQYDYNLYTFDIVTIQVTTIVEITLRCYSYCTACMCIM